MVFTTFFQLKTPKADFLFLFHTRLRWKDNRGERDSLRATTE